MTCLYSLFKGLCIFSICNKHFNINGYKIKTISAGILAVLTLLCFQLNFSNIYISILVDIFIGYYCYKNSNERNSLEIVSTILIIECLTLGIYYIFNLIFPFLFNISLYSLFSSENLLITLMSNIISYLLFDKYYQLEYARKIKCDFFTYSLLITISVIGIGGMMLISRKYNVFKEYELFFLMLSFVYISIITVIIFFYQTYKFKIDEQQKIYQEQYKLLELEKDVLKVQSKMIVDIRHDLRYFSMFINNELKDSLNKTLSKIDEYDNYFLFDNYLMNNLILRLRKIFKNENKELIIVSSRNNVQIDIKNYNDLVQISTYIAKKCINENVHLKVNIINAIIVFEFICNANISNEFIDDMNLVITKLKNGFILCSYIIE